jgi:hypothetical protein
VKLAYVCAISYDRSGQREGPAQKQRINAEASPNDLAESLEFADTPDENPPVGPVLRRKPLKFPWTGRAGSRKANARRQPK